MQPAPEARNGEVEKPFLDRTLHNASADFFFFFFLSFASRAYKWEVLTRISAMREAGRRKSGLAS
jgi:hypothetical protein